MIQKPDTNFPVNLGEDSSLDASGILWAPIDNIEIYKAPTISDLLVYEKNSNGNIHEYLRVSEMDCKCENKSCRRTLVNSRTASSFYIVRKYFGKKIFINSGFRCIIHNEAIGGKILSYHTLGCAMDLRPEKEEDLHTLIKLCKEYFDVVIPYLLDGFVHVHQLPH